MYSFYCVVEQKSDNRGTRLANEYSISVPFRRNYFATIFNQLIVLSACINRFFLQKKKKKKNFSVEKLFSPLKESPDKWILFSIYNLFDLDIREEDIHPFAHCVSTVVDEIRFTELPFDLPF